MSVLSFPNLGELAEQLKHVPAAELFAEVIADGGVDGPGLNQAERDALAAKSLGGKSAGTLDTYRPSAVKAEWFMKYGHESEECQAHSQKEMGRKLTEQSTNLTGEHAVATVVRLYLWAAANFPGFYEAFPHYKKPPIVTDSHFGIFAATIQCLYKLQVTRAGLSAEKRTRIREYPEVEAAFQAGKSTITARGRFM